MISSPITSEALQRIKNSLPMMPEKEKRRVLELLETYKTEKTRVAAKDDFLSFIQHVYPGYKVGPHHKKLAYFIEEIAAGRLKRVMVSIAPRMGKSEMISYLAPSWFLGKSPQKKVIMASHTADLAVNFGRRVRNLVSSESFKDIFPQVSLQADSKSASRWGTNFNGEYHAMGVGGAMAGKGGDLVIIDDPHSEQEGKMNDPKAFHQAYEWFQSGPLQRLMPGGAIIIVMCMTGDTPVLMADGKEKRLDKIIVGDEVATYENGTLTTSKILNWQSNGCDPCFKITMTSGKILRANERHPFLVEDNGELKWIKTRDLKLIHRIVCLKDNGVNGKAKFASTKVVWNLLSAKDSVCPITTKFDGHLDIEEFPIVQQIDVVPALKIAMGLLRKILIGFFKIKERCVQFVNNLLQNITLVPIGAISCVSTMNTAQDVFEDYSATTATWLWGIQKPQQLPGPWQGISDFTTDQIVNISPVGQQEVFDIEVERTGNFIANGFVSHNTRWSKTDLIGQILDHSLRNEDADQWEVVEFPAIFEDETEKEEDGSPVIRSLWPEFWPVEELLAKKATMDPRYWSSQYLQNPTSEEGALIKSGWWKIWEQDSPPSCEFIIMALDSAQETNNRADYNALTTWGVFLNEKTNNYNIILLNAIKQRMEYPDLKKLVLEEYREWGPDAFIVEKKSSGSVLFQEMRHMGVPVGEFTPGKGQDKIARVNAVSDLFSSGIVWMPDMRWAREVRDECNDFPSGKNDDLVDSTTLALLRFRQGGFIRLPNDEKEPQKYFKSYYGKDRFY